MNLSRLQRGEGTKGYSLQFRQLEFSNAVSALLLSQHNQSNRLKRDNSLLLDDSKKEETNDDVVKFLDATLTVDRLDDLYGAMQYVQVLNFQQQTQQQVSSKTTPMQLVDQGHILKEATERCSLVREIYSIIAVGESHEQLAHEALKNSNKNGVIARLMKEQGAGHGTNTNSSNNSLSWCLRFREYNTDGSKRFGVSKRSSMKKERQVIDGLKPLLQEFGGHVQLKDPDCALYVFQGLNGANLMLVEKIASGALTQKIAPNTRQCVTNTPLCPLSSFIMCNIGRVKEGDRILDPYSGSCSTLLACAIIAPTSQTVGIELADDDVIDRDAIVADFESRGLVPPVGLIHGDCTDYSVREQARTAIGGGAFDVILADPPYGRREKISNGDSRTPLQQLIECIKKDAESKKPLLKRGGRLVVFVPANNGEKLVDNLPSKSELAGARLKLISQIEQPLSLTLSRWLVVFVQE
jgi:tRNA G10  N-methylase Trm11